MITAPREAWINPLLDKLSGSYLTSAWKKVYIFAEVEANPSWKTVEAGAEAARKAEVDTILAVGGGSAMDASKVIAEKSGADFLCTVPTTAGTGGEISPWAVISNTETREKDSVTAKWPDLTILDPELTFSLPPSVTFFTGIDAFIHGLEAYLSSAANPITDALALKGMELVTSHLQTAVNQGDNLESRGGMLQGSLLTGAAMLHAGLGLMHAIGNVTGGLYHELTHGLVLLQCMDAVLAYNMPASGEKYSRVESMVETIRRISADTRKTLSAPDITVKKEDVDLLAERACENVNAKTNPRPADPEAIAGIVYKAFMIV
jgi:alcohol dehydrogenase class IV